MMKEHVLISIIIVCYNYANLLHRTLRQIEIQSFHDFEIVFVNNGSTDDSKDVIKRFISLHPAIRSTYVEIEKNIGLSNGENKGVEAATGEYLMFHDADDWMDEETLSILADAVKNKKADRVVCAFRDVDEKGRVRQIQSLGKEPIDLLYGMQQANLFRASIYKKNNIKTNSLWVDAEKTFKFSAYTKNCAFVFNPCYNYLVHLDSTSRNKKLYTLFYDDETYSFSYFMEQCYPYLLKMDAPRKKIAEYQLTRYYYSYLFQFTRDAPLKCKFEIYDQLHSQMKRSVPSYLRSTYTVLRVYKNATRPYAIKIAKFASFLERYHLMKIGLIGFHIVSKFFYFQV